MVVSMIVPPRLGMAIAKIKKKIAEGGKKESRKFFPHRQKKS
jgi:hypothetical protein